MKIHSRDVINYIKKNVDKENYISMFVAGSFPEELIPQGDLDVFFVIKSGKKDEFFNQLSKNMKKYVKSNPVLTYSFFRGPLKYENKALIHFLVYTYGEDYDKNNKEFFLNEHRTVLKKISKQARIISGKAFEEILNSLDLNEKEATSKATKRSSEKLGILLKEDYIEFPEWKKTRGKWKLSRTKKRCSPYLKSYLINYFNKNLGENK